METIFGGNKVVIVFSRLQEYGLNIDYVNADKIIELVPGINKDSLLGGTYSPEDGNSSPLLALHAFYRKSKEFGADYNFSEEVISITTKNKKITET